MQTPVYDDEDQEATPDEIKSVALTVISSLVLLVVTVTAIVVVVATY